MERKSLTDRQKAALTVLDREDGPIHCSNIARQLDGAGASGAGWSSTLRALEGIKLVRANYVMHGIARFQITDAGREALRS